MSVRRTSRVLRKPFREIKILTAVDTFTASHHTSLLTQYPRKYPAIQAAFRCFAAHYKDFLCKCNCLNQTIYEVVILRRRFASAAKYLTCVRESSIGISTRNQFISPHLTRGFL